MLHELAREKSGYTEVYLDEIHDGCFAVMVPRTGTGGNAVYVIGHLEKKDSEWSYTGKRLDGTFA